MEMKKSIAALAISASSAFALIGPGSESKTICLNKYNNTNGVSYAGSCDESRNNVILKKYILENGCAIKQIAIKAQGYNGKFNVQVNSCLPPNVAQL